MRVGRCTTGSSDAIDDDLDLPTALAVVRETLRADLPADERRWLVLDADRSSGSTSTASGTRRGRDDAAAGRPCRAAVVDARGGTHGGRARDFARADALRAEIEAARLGRRGRPPDGSTVRRRAWWPKPSSD